MKAIEISDRASELLSDWVYDHQSDSSHDPRGFYAEFDSHYCKPSLPIHIAELIENNLVTVHEDSDYIPSLDELQQAEESDSDESWSGVAFLTITEKGLIYLDENGLI
jgi:hypothetical protein